MLLTSDFCLFRLSSANPRCVTHGPLHHTGAAHLHPDRGWNQRDHRGLRERPQTSHRFKTRRKRATCLFISVSLQKRHKADNTVNKKKTTGVACMRVDALFRSRVCSWGFCFSVTAKQIAVVCHSVGRQSFSPHEYCMTAAPPGRPH